MKKRRIVLIGASDHCRYTLDIIEKEGKYSVLGIFDAKLKKGTLFQGYEVLGYLDELKEVHKNDQEIAGLVAIGDNFTRKKVVSEILTIMPDFKFGNAIHPSVVLGKDVAIGVGNVFMAGVIVNNNSIIGNHCFLATKASLDHDSTIGDYSSLSPGVTTGGRVMIGHTTAIGIGATILHYISIGNECVIGGGSLVNREIENNYLAYGIPAKKIKKRSSEEKYL